MRIGELARRSGTPTETIRYYEREGLLPAPARSEGNYRLYTERHAERLAFIRQCRHLDMTLGEVRELLALRDQPQADCGAVNALLDEHIGDVAARIAALQALQAELTALRARCQTPQSAAACGILQGLDEAGAAATPTPGHRHVRGTH